MKKKILIISVVVLAICMLFAMTNTVKAETSVTDVNTLDALKTAVQTENANIKLTADITVTEKIDVTKNVTIDGNGHKISYASDATGWQSHYGLQMYNNTATIKNITLTGGDAGLLINGAKVTLEGTINVSGNEFGGIELTKGSGVTTEPTVTFSNAKIVNTTEKYKVPTMWTDSLTTEPTVSYSFTKMNVKKSDDNTQTQYYLNGIVVDNEADLKDALVNTEIKEIKLAKDITTTNKINIENRTDLTIDGQNHKITLNKGDKTVWGGNYVLQAYKSNVTIKNIKLTGGNAGLLVNGSNVTLEGTIDVSGNGFGGIELTKGTNVTTEPTITFSNTTLVNTTEKHNVPTIWEDPEMDKVINDYWKYVQTCISVEAENGNVQRHYYLDYKNIYGTPDEQIQENIKDKDIYVTAEKDDSISKEVLNSLKGKDVTVHVWLENGIDITFNGKNITEDFTNDLSLNVNVTEKQPFTSNVLKDDDTDKLFIDLEYSGALPKGTQITIYTRNVYNEGDKVSLYYYNPKTDKVELISDAVDIEVYREEGYPEYNSEAVTITIDHASTYFLSKAKVETPVQENEELDETPKTGVVSYTAIVAGVVLASVAGVIALRKRA